MDIQHFYKPTNKNVVHWVIAGWTGQVFWSDGLECGVWFSLSMYASQDSPSACDSWNGSCEKCNRNHRLLLRNLKKKYVMTNIQTFSDITAAALMLPIGLVIRNKFFSVMSRIWLRSSVAQDRFSDLSLLHIENDFFFFFYSLYSSHC